MKERNPKNGTKVIKNRAKESLNNIEGSKPNDMDIDGKVEILANIVDDHDSLNASKYDLIDKRTTMDIDPKAQAMEIDVIRKPFLNTKKKYNEIRKSCVT